MRLFVLRVLLVASAVSMAAPAHALNDVYANEHVRVTAMGPDWTWQKQRINLLFVLENLSETPQSVAVELVFPKGREDHFGLGEDSVVQFEETLEPHASARRAMTGIQVLDGVARQTYDFSIRISNGDEKGEIAYPLNTVRGAVVNPGKAAAYVPAALGVLWCFVIVAVMRRHGEKGAWKRPGNPVEDPHSSPSDEPA